MRELTLVPRQRVATMRELTLVPRELTLVPEVERLGWRWVGRVRGRDYVRPGKTWINYKSLFKKATTKARRMW